MATPDVHTISMTQFRQLFPVSDCINVGDDVCVIDIEHSHATLSVGYAIDGGVILHDGSGCGFPDQIVLCLAYLNLAGTCDTEELVPDGDDVFFCGEDIVEETLCRDGLAIFTDPEGVDVVIRIGKDARSLHVLGEVGELPAPFIGVKEILD